MTAKKPANRRQNRNTTPVVLQAVPITPAVDGIPQPPAHYDPWTQQHWRDFWESEVSKASGTADLWAVETFFDCLNDYRESLTIGRAEPYIEGSTGQRKLNPMLSRADALRKDLPRLAAEIGASPLARSKLAIEVGNAAKTIEDLTREAKAGDDDAADLAALVEPSSQDG